MAITAATLMVKVEAETSSAQRALSSLGKTVDEIGKKVNRIGPEWNRVINSMKMPALALEVGLLAGAVGLVGMGMVKAAGLITDLGQEAFSASVKAEQLRFSLQNLSALELMKSGTTPDWGAAFKMSSERAEELMGWVDKLAVASPVGREQVQQLLSIGMQFGLNSQQAKRATQAVLDYGAAHNSSQSQMSRTVAILGSIGSHATLTSGDLQDLSSVGIDGLKILADAAGVSEESMWKAIDNGIVPTGPALEALVLDMEEYKGAAEAASTATTTGLLETLGDLKEISLTTALGPMFEAMKPALESLTTTLSKPEIQDGLKQLGTSLGNIASSGVNAVLDEMPGALESLNLALADMPTDTPGWIEKLRSIDPAGWDQIAEDLADLQAIWNALTAGDTQAVFDIVFPQMPPEFQNWVNWVSDESKREITLGAKWAESTQADLQTSLTGYFASFPIAIKATASWAEGVLATMKFNLEANVGHVQGMLSWAPGAIDTAKTELDRYFSSYVVIANVVGQWFTGTVGNLWTQLQAKFNDPTVVYGSWNNGTPTTLHGQVQTEMNNPFVLFGSWASDTLSGLWQDIQDWFNARPILIPGQAGPEGGWTPEQPSPSSPSSYPGWEPTPYGAQGFTDFAGGLAVVGEQGKEIVDLPPHSNVYSYGDSKRIASMLGIPGFAEGTTSLPPGVWPSMPSTFGAVGNLLKGAAKDAGKEFVKSVKEATRDFTAALRSTPGLFGTSQVTSEQMKLAELGVPQEFGDDYLRRLTDEVLNGVPWDDVDIKEAAAAAGIDPNLPAKAILEMFRQAWQDSSLFANPENLKLINTDAIKAQIQKQQASEAGQANILALFGVGDEELVAQIAGLGVKVQTGLQQYLSEEGFGPVGAQAATGIGQGIAENGSSMGVGVVGGITNWLGTAEGTEAVGSMGANIAGALNGAFKAAAGLLDWSVPTGQSTPPTTSPPKTPAFASGTLFSPEGRALLGETGPELVDLPLGSRVYSAKETSSMIAPVTVIVNATMNKPYDMDLLARRVARVIQQKQAF